MDARKYYLKGLLNQLKRNSNVCGNEYSPQLYTQNYRITNNQEEDNVKVATKLEILNMAIDYIKELEDKIEELSYIQNIINVAKIKEVE